MAAKPYYVCADVQPTQLPLAFGELFPHVTDVVSVIVEDDNGKSVILYMYTDRDKRVNATQSLLGLNRVFFEGNYNRKKDSAPPQGKASDFSVANDAQLAHVSRDLVSFLGAVLSGTVMFHDTATKYQRAFNRYVRTKLHAYENNADPDVRAEFARIFTQSEENGLKYTMPARVVRSHSSSRDSHHADADNEKDSAVEGETSRGRGRDRQSTQGAPARSGSSVLPVAPAQAQPVLGDKSGKKGDKGKQVVKDGASKDNASKPGGKPAQKATEKTTEEKPPKTEEEKEKERKKKELRKQRLAAAKAAAGGAAPTGGTTTNGPVLTTQLPPPQTAFSLDDQS